MKNASYGINFCKICEKQTGNFTRIWAPLRRFTNIKPRLLLLWNCFGISDRWVKYGLKVSFCPGLLRRRSTCWQCVMWKLNMKKCTKNGTNCYVSHKNESLFIFWQLILFLLLCDNNNISPWHNILNHVQNKNLVLHEK